MSRKVPPDSLQSRSAGEQLRADHIETLEVLQQTKKENKQLKEELKALRGTKGSVDVSAEEEESGAGAGAGSELDLLELVEQNTRQQEELKLTKARLQQAERDLLREKQASSSAAGAQIAAMRGEGRKKEALMADAVAELETENGTLRSELGDAVEAQQRAEQQLGSARREVEELRKMGAEWAEQQNAFREEMVRIEAQVGARADTDRSHFQQALEAKSAAFERQLQQQLQQQRQLAEQNTALRREAAAQVEVRFELQQRARAMEDTCARQLDSIAALEAAQALALAQEPQGDTFLFTAPDCAVAPATASVSALSALAPTADSNEGEASFRFQEFLRLKRENKELKLRLADPTQQTAQQTEAPCANCAMGMEMGMPGGVAAPAAPSKSGRVISSNSKFSGAGSKARQSRGLG